MSRTASIPGDLLEEGDLTSPQFSTGGSDQLAPAVGRRTLARRAPAAARMDAATESTGHEAASALCSQRVAQKGPSWLSGKGGAGRWLPPRNVKSGDDQALSSFGAPTDLMINSL